MLKQHTHPRRSAPGFSLIEILVVISIITLLVGISFPVALKMLAQSEVAQASGMLLGIEAAAGEYNVVTGATIDHTVGTVGGNNDNTIGVFLSNVMNLREVENIILSAAKDNYSNDADGNGMPKQGFDDFSIVDPWGTKIRYARLVDKTDSYRDDDYLPAYPRPFFVSAGPDGLFGSVNNNGEADEEAQDNVYSYNVN